jgi:hypothetical protein
MKKLLILLFILSIAQVAQADVFRCQVNGKTVYQETSAAGCVATGISTIANPEDELLAQVQAERNSREYRESMNAWEQWENARGWAKIDAMNERTRQVSIETGMIRARTAEILNDIGVVHPPTYGTSFFPMPVVVVNRPPIVRGVVYPR